MSLQDQSRAAGRTILPTANPDCERCAASGWYMVGLGGDFEDCDCTVVTEWEPAERFEIAGRGTVFTGRLPLHTKGNECIGRKLLINGEVWVIRGYEKFMTAMPLSYGDDCGLLVKRIEE